METIIVNGRLTSYERETVLNYNSVDKLWIMETTIPKYFHKALKQGWTPIRRYMYEDGTVCGMVLTAPERAVTIRNVSKKRMSDTQMSNLEQSLY